MNELGGGVGGVAGLNACLFLCFTNFSTWYHIHSYLTATTNTLGTSEKMWINYEGIINVIEKGRRVST